jgi:hypothetical protein
LNSGVNDRRGRGFFRSIVSILNILSGAVPLMVDVRQTGGSPYFEAVPAAAKACHPQEGDLMGVPEYRFWFLVGADEVGRRLSQPPGAFSQPIQTVWGSVNREPSPIAAEYSPRPFGAGTTSSDSWDAPYQALMPRTREWYQAVDRPSIAEAIESGASVRVK